MSNTPKTYWITLAVKAMCEEAAENIAQDLPGEVISVDHEPPQGSLIVGPMHEDEL